MCNQTINKNDADDDIDIEEITTKPKSEINDPKTSLKDNENVRKASYTVI